MRRFIRKRIEDCVRVRNHVTEADMHESTDMYRQYRFK